MINRDLFDYYQQINTSHILMTFKGAISHDLLTEFGDFIKKQLQSKEQIQRVFAVFVEMAQNIHHYSAEREVNDNGVETGVGLIVISEMDKNYYISSGNHVSKSTAESLSEQCEYLKTLDKDSLKKLYITRRKEDPPPGSKGAGLGLIDMARKSDEPIDFHIQEINDSHSFFTLNICINKTTKIEAEQKV